MVLGLKPQHGANGSPALQKNSLGLLAFLFDMFIPRKFAVKRNSEEFCCVSDFDFGAVYLKWS